MIPPFPELSKYLLSHLHDFMLEFPSLTTVTIFGIEELGGQVCHKVMMGVGVLCVRAHVCECLTCFLSAQMSCALRSSSLRCVFYLCVMRACVC